MARNGEHFAVPWSTPLRDYQDYGGIKIAAHGSAVWRLEDSDFPYAEFTPEQLQYNPKTVQIG